MSGSTLVIENCAVATVEPEWNEYASGHLVQGGRGTVRKSLAGHEPNGKKLKC